jgi:RNA polymerase sigma-70 factor, ECF subfamily
MKTRGLRARQKKNVYDQLRALLFSIAYRMLGSASDAEDIVQDALLQFHRESQKGTVIDSPEAWLSTVTTRLSINHIKSARVRRESYVGTWLPEPLVTDPEPEGVRHAETADSLSLAFLVLLESLGPVERAVFLLHDVFDYGYDEIAAVVGKSEDNCRQIAARARKQIDAKRPRFEASRKKREELSRRFFDAVEVGDTEGLIGLLAADVVAYGDGGGKATASPRPIHGREKVARLLVGTRHLFGANPSHAEVNGQPGVLLFDTAGHLTGVITLDILDDQIQTVRAVLNPDKLRHLDPGL